MATTLLSDVIVPEVFTPYVQRMTAERSQLFNSGIIGGDPTISNKLSGGGEIVKMPFWNDLDQSAHNMQSDTTIPTGKIGTGQDQARLLYKAGGWEAEDLAGELAGDDPMQAIGNRIADWWGRKMQTILISLLTGVFAANAANNMDSGSASDQILDVTISGSDALTADALISGENILDAKQLMGDSKEKLTAIVMHSMLHTRLQKNDLIDRIPDSEQDVGWGTYLGHTVVVDDDCPRSSSGADNAEYEYTSYLFGTGAIGFAEENPDVPTETERDAANSKESLFNRRQFIFHPRGWKWTEDTVTNDFPTNSNLEVAANWQRVFDKKNVRLVKMVTNG